MTPRAEGTKTTQVMRSFECDQYEGDLSEYRPDMPSGDLTVDLRCWIENPNEYNITVNHPPLRVMTGIMHVNHSIQEGCPPTVSPG